MNTTTDTATQPESTKPQISRSVSSKGDKITSVYVPSIPIHKTERMTAAAIRHRYGIELPAKYDHMSASDFSEECYTTATGDKQRVLVPRRTLSPHTEHDHDFYQRVGIPLPSLS